MMTELFNSIFELSIRALLVLNNARQPLSEEKIATTDFITIYGTDFGISDTNLHGDNTYKYCESATRHRKMDLALKDLSLRGMIDMVLSKKSGVLYRINEIGMKFCQSLESSYAKEYTKLSEYALEYISLHGIKEVRSEILRNSQTNIRRNANE